MTNFKYTKLALKDYNRTYFGHDQSKISELKNYILTLQQLPQSNHTLEQEELACKELDEILKRERII